MTFARATLVAISLFYPNAAVIGAQQSASVEITFVDAHGRSAGRTRVAEFIDNSGRDFADHFTGAKGVKIPFGKYQLRLSSEDLGTRIDHVEVDREQISLVVTGYRVYTDYPPGREPKLDGRILVGLSTPRESPIWIKLVPLYRDWSMMVPVRQDKTFSLTGVPDGAYVLLVLTGPNVLKMARINIDDPNSVVEVDLDGGEPTVTPRSRKP